MLDIDGVTVSYGAETVIEDLTWSAGGPGALVTALLGPSGCGKSTLIRAVAGLEQPAAGVIRFDGADLSGLATHRRDFGVVFQDGQLFGGRSVGANIAYGLRIRRWSRAAIADRVAEMLELVALPGIAKRAVAELSGGQAQRVALARALAPAPRLLLLDEPLAALDRRLRDNLAVQIGEIVRAAHTPTIVVTHDHGEAALMADSISVMRDGAIVQSARPAELWARPLDEWTARFLGCTSVIEARRVGNTLADTDFGLVEVDLPTNVATLGLRAESVMIEPGVIEPGNGTGDGLAGQVLTVAELPTGPRVRISTALGEFDAVAQSAVRVGDEVTARLVPRRLAVVGK